MSTLLKKSIAIICGGGPAPGINTVISTLAKTFLKDGYNVLGVHHGYKGLFSENPSVKSFDYQSADRIFSLLWTVSKKKKNNLISKIKESQFHVNWLSFFVSKTLLRRS